MSKIAFFNIPAHGHTNPTLAVVRELISRGHEIRYYSYNMLRDKIESTGAVFVSCDDYDAEKKISSKEASRIGKDLALSIRILVDTTLALDDKVCEDMKKFKPDCIVADSMAVWGKVAAMKLGIPFVSSTTTFAFNEKSAKIMKQGAADIFKMIISMPSINRDIRRLKDRGYPVKNILDIIANNKDTHTIVYTSPEFQPCSDDFPCNYVFAGPMMRPADGEVLKTKEKLIYISMGTVNNDLPSLYKELVCAFSNTDYQIIMSVGDSVAIDEIGKLPENISVFSHVDQMAVLKKADIFISHCGMNSVNESLYFSVPLIMLPQTAEQGGVAERVQQLGAGIKLDKTDEATIIEAVEKILSDTSYKANAGIIAESFRRCSGAKGAADKIESICNNK